MTPWFQSKRFHFLFCGLDHLFGPLCRFIWCLICSCIVLFMICFCLLWSLFWWILGKTRSAWIVYLQIYLGLHFVIRLLFSFWFLIFWIFIFMEVNMSFVRLPATVLNDRFLLENELYLVYWIEIWIFLKFSSNKYLLACLMWIRQSYFLYIYVFKGNKLCIYKRIYGLQGGVSFIFFPRMFDQTKSSFTFLD
jgi:hypothetical protein